MATSGERQQAKNGSHETASSSSLSLPDRKMYLTTLASVAFVSGLTVATVVTIRRSRKMQLEDLRSAAAAAAARASAEGPTVHHAPDVLKASPTESPLTEARSKGPGALFKEMNRAIFDSRQRGVDAVAQSSDTPSILQRKRPPQLIAPGKTPKASVFDAPASSSAPSVLMRGSTQQKEDMSPQKAAVAAAATVDEQSLSSVLQQLREMKTKNGEDSGSEQEPGLGAMPAVLALKALGVATIAVGAGALLFVELACRIFGVSSMDELVEKLTTMRPLSERFNVVGDRIGRSARRTLNGLTGVYEDMDTSTTMTDDELRQAGVLSHEQEREPLPVNEAMSQLEDAVGRGDAAAWMSIISQQLNAERRQDLQERQRRLDARAAEKAAQARSV